jgi:hypothetical protein
MTKPGALPFSRSLREGGAFRGLPVTARLVDFVFQSERKPGPAPVGGNGLVDFSHPHGKVVHQERGS